MGTTQKKTKTQKKIKSSSSKSNVLKDIVTAMTNNQFGMGGASMSSLQPTVQQKIEDQQIIDETAEATGLERDKGLLKGNATDSKDVAQNLKDRDVAVTEDYKKKNADVYNKVDFKVGDKANMSDNDYSLADVLKMNDNDPKKVRDWLRNHPAYEQGSKTKEWLKNNPLPNSVITDSNKKGDKMTLADLRDNETDQQYSDALNDAQFVENISKTQKKDESDYDDMSKIVEKFNEKSSNIEDYYKENLPKFLWKMYKDGDIDKSQLGYFILNGLSTGLVNASLVARGMSPTQESDLQKLRREKLEGALDRYNQKRNETMNTTLKQLGLNAEMLNKFNMDVDTLKNNKIFEEVSKSLDRKGMERTVKAYTLAGNYLDGLTDEQKSNVFMAIMALNSSDGKSAGISYLVSTLGKPFADNILSMFK